MKQIAVPARVGRGGRRSSKSLSVPPENALFRSPRATDMFSYIDEVFS
ncbi:hypothetical protein [Bosea rubneri]|uniref:Uncharacterized protein n=1 Tax=Bosea rubneri TaxID=3075434 RepID=A0ABU3S1W3_9HYPH|nr:hypothetical protein [Bosea sp. ZW T0_25]MDU0338755.1 hypothetical protein [Bosea sp. ZW T0_25]